MELINFVESIQGKAKPIVDGVAGKEALGLHYKYKIKYLKG